MLADCCAAPSKILVVHFCLTTAKLKMFCLLYFISSWLITMILYMALLGLCRTHSLQVNVDAEMVMCLLLRVGCIFVLSATIICLWWILVLFCHHWCSWVSVASCCYLLSIFFGWKWLMYWKEWFKSYQAWIPVDSSQWEDNGYFQ